MPRQCTAADLEGADRIVALKESEHRPLVASRFPGWDSCIEYWHIDDVEDTPSAVAPRFIADEITAFLKRLQLHQASGDTSLKSDAPLQDDR